MGAVNTAFAAALLKLNFTSEPMRSKMAQMGTSLSINTALKAKEDTFEHQRAVEESAQVAAEELAGEAQISRAKLPASLCSGGEQSTIDDLLATMANLYCVLALVNANGP